MGYRTYIDTGVLIAAVRGPKEIADRALAFLHDPLRDYVTSDYVKVELLPKCRFHRRKEEEDFYEDFFSGAVVVPSSDELLAFAIDEGGKTGISGVDAIHVACAVIGEAQELITTEKSTHPIHRANGVTVISVYP